MDNGPIVLLDGVSYYYPGRDTPALRDVSLQIERGTLNILIGPSGSGKTTLCDIMCGAIPHLYGGKLTGEVVIDALNTRECGVNDIALRAGKVFQDPEVMFSTLQVEDEIAFGPENLGLDGGFIADTVERILGYVELAELRHNLVWELSGGQTQRLGLGCILAMRTPVIILDEPTANLDPAGTNKVHSLALRLKEEGITVILVTKESDELLARADRLFVLDEGRLVLAGEPQSLIDEHGDYLTETLGVWLPEVSELVLGMRSKGLVSPSHIPLTVEQAVALFEEGQIGFSPIPGNGDGSSQAVTRRRCVEEPVLISAEDLRYTYQGDREALRGVSFTIHRGDILAIVGRNGAGKTTLAKLLVGLLKPGGGKLELFGRDAAEWDVPSLAQQIALVFQNPEHQFLTDTVFDEVAYSCLARSGGLVDPGQLKATVNSVLADLDLEDVVDDHPFSLSAGKKRRVGVAAMLVGSPEVLVVDEPTYGQDRALTKSLMDLIVGLRDEGITILLITHNMRLVEQYADRVIVMNGGLITFDGRPDELFVHPEVLEQASLSTTALRALVYELRRMGVPVPSGIRSVSEFLLSITRKDDQGQRGQDGS